MNNYIAIVSVIIGLLISVNGNIYAAMDLTHITLFRRVMVHLLFTTAILWFPWVMFSVVQLCKMNIACINYIERADEVIPKEPRVINLNNPSDGGIEQ